MLMKGFRSVQNFDQGLSRQSLDREKMAEISFGVELDRGGHRSCIPNYVATRRCADSCVPLTDGKFQCVRP